MPDWVRIGPPYGQINELMRPFVNTAALASADVQRYGVGGHWAADNWSPVVGSAIASWSITPSPGLQTMDANGLYNVVSNSIEARQWQIYNATTMPPNTVVAVATVALPYAATGMMVFEMVGGATFAPFPVVPEFVPPSLTAIVASANGSVIGSTIPVSGSAAIFDMSRSYLHYPVPTASLTLNEETQFAQFRYVGITFRTVGSVASGAMLRIQSMRLSVLPVPWIGTSAGALATAALAVASSLVGTWFSQDARGIHIGPWGVSRLARYPAIATTDGQQPNGAAYEIGSAMIAGQAQWGSDLVQKNYAMSLLSPGDPLAFERIPNRNLVFPYISRQPSSNSHLFQRELERAIKPGNVVDVIPEDAQNFGGASGFYRRFDLVDGRVVNNEDIRYQRAGIARGEVQLTTLPYPRSASYVSFSLNASGALPFNVFMPGEVPAAAFFSYANNLTASGPSANAILRGFMAVIVPSIATYLPISPNPTGLGNAAASMPNGYRAAGSQLHFQTFLLGGGQVARGFFTPGQQEAVAGRVRAFAIIANATACTIPLYLSLQVGPAAAVATALSNIGYSKPLYVVGSEMRQLAFVDLGEVRLPVDPIQMAATVQWDLMTATAASANATAGIFDSVVFLPISDPLGWFGAVASGRNQAQYIVTASTLLLSDQQVGQYGQTAGGQAFLPFITRVGVYDQTSVYQGRSPYITPGQSWAFCAPIAMSGASQARPMSGGSATWVNSSPATLYAYPRFVFLQ